MYRPLSAAPSSPLEAAPVNHYASTLEATLVRAQDVPRRCDWSKIRQDGRQLYDTVRHTATRREIVWQACKSPPPWPIKGRRSPSRRGIGHGTTDSSHSHALRLSHDIGTRLNQTSRTWRPRLFSHLACSHPSTSTPVPSNTVPRAHPCWMYDPGRNQDKPSVLSCLALTIERQISALITS
jgi:hypothetical protein